MISSRLQSCGIHVLVTDVSMTSGFKVVVVVHLVNKCPVVQKLEITLSYLQNLAIGLSFESVFYYFIHLRAFMETGFGSRHR